MTPARFINAARKAEAGSRIVYHTGFLAGDREESADVHAVGCAALFLGDELKLGALVQSKHEALKYDYILVLRRPLAHTEIAMLQRLIDEARREKRDELRATERLAA